MNCSLKSVFCLNPKGFPLSKPIPTKDGMMVWEGFQQLQVSDVLFTRLEYKECDQEGMPWCVSALLDQQLIFSLNPARVISQTMQSCVLIVLDSKLMGIVTWDFEFSRLTKLDASGNNFLHRVWDQWWLLNTVRSCSVLALFLITFRKHIHVA